MRREQAIRLRGWKAGHLALSNRDGRRRPSHATPAGRTIRRAMGVGQWRTSRDEADGCRLPHAHTPGHLVFPRGLYICIAPDRNGVKELIPGLAEQVS